MHRFARLAEKQDTKLESEEPEEPKAKKNRNANRISNIGTLDNGTMVEAFKYLSYCQLAKNSLVSKRFLDVIQTHRHKFALLYVDSICMERHYNCDPAIKIFDSELSSKEYNEWVVRNNYSKQTLLQSSTPHYSFDYQLSAYGDYKDPIKEKTSVFFALIKELDNGTWPLFEHFVRLLSDPFVFIRDVKLSPQTDVFNLLAATIDRSNRSRLQCEELEFNYEGHPHKFFNWIKDHVRCVKFQVAVSDSSAYHDKQLLDFCATGSHCTSKVLIIYTKHIYSNIVLTDLMQKFVDFKSCDECHIIHTIQVRVSEPAAEALKSNYAKFFVKEEKDEDGWNTVRIYEFVNTDVGKKMQLAVSNAALRRVTLKIINL